ncbi:Multidrug resistance protein stp [Mycolicibacterium chlorophenolicum]|nr:Multidrug resistance protein stp [Mycolicibacterium chlorophenolicum]
MGTGLGICMAPATAAIVAATPVEKHGVAAAVNDAAREVGAAVGIAIAGSVLAAGYTDRITPALPGLPGPARGPFSDSLAAALQAGEKSGPAREQLATIAKSAFMHGYGHAGVVLSGITVASALILAIGAPGRRDATLDGAENRGDNPLSGTTARPHSHTGHDMPDDHDEPTSGYQQVERMERFDDSP